MKNSSSTESVVDQDLNHLFLIARHLISLHILIHSIFQVVDIHLILHHLMFVVYLKREVNRDQITEIIALRGILIWNMEDVHSK